MVNAMVSMAAQRHPDVQPAPIQSGAEGKRQRQRQPKQEIT